MISKMRTKCMNPNTGLLIIRLALGIIFMAHGWAKLANMGGTIEFFGQLGLPVFTAYAVALIEFLGGIAMIVGFGTHTAGLLIAIVMLGSIITVKSKQLSLMGPGGFEIDLALLAMSLAIVFAGPGRYRLFKGCACGCKKGVCKNGKCECHDCDCLCAHHKK